MNAGAGEARLLAREYGLEAPVVHGAVDEDGRVGITFDKVYGPTYTQWLIEHPNWLRRLTEYFAHEQNEVHKHKIPELPRLKDILVERMVAKKELTEAERKRELERIARMPEGEWTLHMDFVPDSTMVSIDGPLYFNWGMACRGDYLADVAMSALLMERWEPREDEKESVEVFGDMFRNGYVLDYIKICGRMDEELDAWKDVLRAVFF